MDNTIVVLHNTSRERLIQNVDGEHLLIVETEADYTLMLASLTNLS